MKAILISIRPEWVAKILNGEKTIEIRKKFPKDYVGWVYIYCTKDREILSYQTIPHDRIFAKGYDGFNDKDFDFQFITLTKTDINNGWGWFARNNNLNGKVVARFWCDKVEEIKWELPNKLIFPKNMLENACLSGEELYKYLGEKGGYAIHITKLEIFDEPKEISEFSVKVFPHRKDNLMTRYLTCAPQSFCFIEV